MQGFADLLTLQPNWDSYGGGAIDPKVIHGRQTPRWRNLGGDAPKQADAG
ncbi:MAG TPA: hypothetical protein VNY05_25880 [Candidatus Acidoferrales bacterium]|jgi:hypothetical protein|nr:hypothetical protein [Candidatus Acidoferrales bacterium]